MPKINPIVKTRPNFLSAELHAYTKASGLTSEQIAARVGESPETTRRKLNQAEEKWRIGDLRRYCAIIGMPFSAALNALGRER